MINLFKIYNQGLEYFTRNWCSVYTLFHIVQIQWGIKVSNTFIIQTLKLAEVDKAWYEAWGAYFAKIYNWFVWAVFKKTWVKLIVRTVDIRSKEFEELYELWYFFWLGLKYAWLWYRGARKDWIITAEEANKDTSGYWVYGHNHTFGKELLIDSLKWVEPTKMTLEVLREAVNNWIYYPNARTLVMEDRLLDYYLKFFQKGWVIKKVEDLETADRRAVDKALKLRTMKK